MPDTVPPHADAGPDAPGPAPHPSAVAITELADALQLGPRELVSLVGGGGKTTALFALGRQLPPPVILTTTTKMGRDRTGGYPILWSPSDGELADAVTPPQPVLVWRKAGEEKAGGVAPEVCDQWFAEHGSVVVEADGSRRRPFKAPRAFEPVIPSATTTLVACVGADALGRVIADQCQRPLRVAAVAGCSPYERLTPDRLATVLTSDRGSAKDLPPGARFVVLINQATSAHTAFLTELAEHLTARAPSTPLVAVAPYTPEQSPEGP